MAEAPVRKIIQFRGEYRFLSNSYYSSIAVDGEAYPTVEHAYQAAKCTTPVERARVRNCNTPGDAKRLGKRVVLRSDWDDIKIRIMHELLRLKFKRGTDLAARLLATGDVELIEGNDWGDTFWGVCRGHGSNHLGKLLMAVRKELRT